ncbi:hypothetical protein EWM64_g3431 [Hericium alpestre]|uniref:VPS9 domain-containing protein n=1 Tax=Hericium alpestre TaxID=135208 RepID=A0A4Z0A2P6_9AGAM|nr:hypothetical protein EWM64_g3431 [Hericium alpestre]
MNLKASVQAVGLDVGSVGWEMLEKLVGEHDHTQEWSDIWTALTTGKATLILPLEQDSHGKITVDFVKDHIILCDGASRIDAPTYPTYNIPSHTATLPLPPHVLTKPPLPPRPGQRPSSSSGTSSRLSTSFASLFGKASTPSNPVSTPSANAEPEHAIEVSAFTIDRRILREDVGKQINKALKMELREALTMSGVSPWIMDRVQEFSTGLYPFVKNMSSVKQHLLSAGGSTPPSPVYAIDPPSETIEELSHQFQEFYASLEEDIRAGRNPATARPRGETFADDQEKLAEKQGNGDASADHVRDTLEAVERIMCSLFYDRLYLQPTSDDASHDAALSDRIAALNLLDLGLEHLGVDAGTVGTDAALASVLRGCGETLSQLDQSACRCPADKAAILVAAHKILVDGLSRLPPIRLKSEAELEQQSSPIEAASRKPKPGEELRELEDKKDGVDAPQPSHLLTTGIDAPPPIIVSPESDSNLYVSSPSSEVNPWSPSHEDGRLSPMAAPASKSSLLTISRPSTPTPVSGDLIVPLMIYAVVKANPQHLVSHLLYTQRFRNERFGGEESYCLVNLMAVADFLENVDLKVLGLGDSEKKVMSTADLTPIPVTRAALGGQSPTSTEGIPSRLRGRVEQQVDAITGSANKVISGVVDSSFGVLRSLLPGNAESQAGSLLTVDPETAPWNARPGFGLLRRESAFSIASLTASLPGRERAKSIISTAAAEESGQMMIEVSSRPGSIRSSFLSDAEASEMDASEDDEGEEEEEEEYEDDASHGDARSIRSFENMMKDKRRRSNKGRKSLTDRLASMPGLSRLSHTGGPQSVPTACGYPRAKLRSYEWGQKAKRRKTTGTGRMRYLKEVSRRFKNGFRENTVAKKIVRASAPSA